MLLEEASSSTRPVWWGPADPDDREGHAVRARPDPCHEGCFALSDLWKAGGRDFEFVCVGRASAVDLRRSQ